MCCADGGGVDDAGADSDECALEVVGMVMLVTMARRRRCSTIQVDLCSMPGLMLRFGRFPSRCWPIVLRCDSANEP